MTLLKRIVFLGAILLVAVASFGQGTTSSLTGSVTTGGDSLPGATVTISSPSMQGARTTVTDVNGNYNFPSIPPGQYSVLFEMDGMASQTRTVRVGLARTERVNASLALSAVAEAITVTAAAPAVLETTEVQSNFTIEEINDLPIGRAIQNIVTLAPGTTTTGPGAAIMISGAFSFDSLFLVNGAVTNENVRGQTDNLFIEDAIEETSVLSGAISAEYGRFTGGVVSAITKSGGNEFSGSFRDSFTNPSWDETTPAGEPQQESNLNQTYEATLGGRVVRDRLWFFGAGRYFEQDLPGFFTNSTIPLPTTVQTDERYEVKLTGQVTPKHNLVGSYLSYEIDQTPHCAFGCWDLSTMDINGRQLPREMITARYSGILTSNFLVEAGYSTRDLVFSGSGGDHVTTNHNDPRDLALGSWAYDISYGGAWGAPIFCGICDDEVRENEVYQLKGTYYLATAGAGSHNIVAGYENFMESRFSNNFQSGSNLDMYIFNGIAPTRTADGSLRPVVSEGDWILWTPIQTLSQGSDFVTDSVFLNDKWDLNQNFSFNLGVRYDKNDGMDSGGNPISKDKNWSPRLGVIYDVRGDGRLRMNASYSRYVSRIQETIGGAGGGGNPSYFIYEYRGPQIGGPDSGLDSFGVLEAAYRWFLNECDAAGRCGRDNLDLLIGAGVPGFNQRFLGDLKSPHVDELTVGVGTQIGRNGFFRVDYIDREWNDFYGLFTSPGDQVSDPLIGTLDVVTTANTNDEKRTYQGVQLQAAYRVTSRLNFGGNYTWSETKGTVEGETLGNGPVGSTINSYREYRNFAQHNPEGFLLADQTHKGRLWASYDLPIGGLGSLSFGLLERFDSGTPYSAVTTVPVAPFVTNPGYETPPSTVNYFFSDRGAFRWEDLTATDVSLTWNLGFGPANLFVKGDLINAFNETAQVGGVTTVRRLASFNPFTTTPIEGAHWEKASNFGQATTAAHYQLPRTWRFTAGIRF
ncbi:MAG TPA: TonB-dependent receptor [Thermoanaerobaculia bacterium]|nr:TonB-dependent receptor [Thermoanaerobaculia bacterium]